MPFQRGSKVEFLEDFSVAKKGDCGVVRRVQNNGRLLITLTHQAECQPIPNLPVARSVSSDILQTCHCPD